MAAQILLGKTRSGVNGLFSLSELHIALLIEGKVVFTADTNSVDVSGLERNLPRILDILKQKGLKAVIEDGHMIQWGMVDGFLVCRNANNRALCEELFPVLRAEAQRILAPVLA